MSKKQEPEQETNKEIVSDKKTITKSTKKEEVTALDNDVVELKPEPVLDEPIEITDKADPLVDDSLKEANEKNLLEVNKTYIKTIGELKGRSFLIEEAIKQK